ncbi:rCG37134 [Rattus norvegicus]|uniref:RCG37134 n=1 Tax=Rattus norvegicus TaxID=10116 RepID=A6HUE5_RAT|nr:rCG37134 [Rattus norvegicus]
MQSLLALKSVTTINQVPHNVLPVLGHWKTLKPLLATFLYFKIPSTHFLNRS